MLIFTLLVVFLAYKDLKNNRLDREKNARIFLNECFTHLYPDDVKEEIKRENLRRYENIIKGFEQDAALFLTHGTATPSSPENYYFSSSGIRDNKTFMQTLASFTKSKYASYLRWSGLLTHEERVKTSLVFKKSIEEKLFEIAKENNLDPKEIPVNLSGHSFGVSVLILTANELEKDGYNVRMLISFNAPVNTYTLKNKKIIHLNFYSSNDWGVQVFGAFYFMNNFKKIDFYGPSRVIYPGAINISIDEIILNEKILFYKNVRPDKRINSNLYHHAARNEIILSLIRKKIDEVSENLSERKEIPLDIKKWEGTYFLKKEVRGIKSIRIKAENNRIMIMNADTGKNIYTINSGDETSFKKKYSVKFIPFASFGNVKNRFYVNEKELFYEERGFILFFNTGAAAKTKIKIIKESDYDVSFSFVKTNL